MAYLKDSEVNGNLHVTEDIQIGDTSVSEELDELNTNINEIKNTLNTKLTLVGSGTISFTVDSSGVYSETITYNFEVTPVAILFIGISNHCSYVNINTTNISSSSFIYSATELTGSGGKSPNYRWIALA